MRQPIWLMSLFFVQRYSLTKGFCVLSLFLLLSRSLTGLRPTSSRVGFPNFSWSFPTTTRLSSPRKAATRRLASSRSAAVRSIAWKTTRCRSSPAPRGSTTCLQLRRTRKTRARPARAGENRFLLGINLLMNLLTFCSMPSVLCHKWLGSPRPD